MPHAFEMFGAHRLCTFSLQSKQQQLWNQQHAHILEACVLLFKNVETKANQTDKNFTTATCTSLCVENPLTLETSQNHDYAQSNAQTAHEFEKKLVLRS